MKEFGNRREFLKTTALAGVGLGLTGSSLSSVRGLSAPSNKVVVAVMGVNGRGSALAEGFARQAGAEVAFICDVDDNAISKRVMSVSGLQDKKPMGEKDFRKVLERDDIDAFVIAAPDHWHTPASIMALQAGKHVYIEKPGSHNPREGEMLVEAQQKYGKIVQLGTQQRSDHRSIEIMQMIKEGIIGEPYYGKAWYANTRGSIGTGKVAEVPSWLDYDLWQGPAPRVDYTDNIIHYNWHWFRNWGTGEACNNATHEVDVCRWALGVDYPIRVLSSGGRYHYDDDWEFYDTQVMSFEYEGGKSITWEGRSCNGKKFFDRGRGATIHGTEGTILMDRDGYIVYDHDSNEVKRNLKSEQSDQLNTVGGGGMTDDHISNFLSAIRDGESLKAPIAEGNKSVLLCHLGNIAQHSGKVLECDPSNGHLKDKELMKTMWGRKYEPGWEVTV